MPNDKIDEFSHGHIFDGKDFDKWRRRMKLYLDMKDCVETIESDERPAEIPEPLWKLKERKAKHYIANGMTNTQFELLLEQDTAKKMMDKLDEIYLVKSSAVKLLCKRKLLDLKMKEDDDPTDFCYKFEKHVNELKNAGEKVREDDKLNYLLLTLPESMSHIMDVVDALPKKDQTVEYVKSKLSLEFQKRQSNRTGRNSTEVFSSQTPRHGRNFQQRFQYNNSRYVNPRNLQTQRQGGDSRSYERHRSNTETVCYKCNQKGHIAKFCQNYSGNERSWRPFNRGNPQRMAGNSTIENRKDGNSFAVEVMTTSTQGSNEEKVPQEETIKWLVDSGCSDHVINTDKYFKEYRVLEEPVDVKVGDGFPLKSTKIGTVINFFQVGNQLNKIEINNVYYVPNMKRNLLSETSITDKDNYLWTEKNNIDIYNKNLDLIAVAERKGKLYELTGIVSNGERSVKSSYSCLTEMTDKEKWHRILGHVNFQDLRRMCNTQMLNGLPIKIEDEYLKCEVCLENKMANLKFRNNRSRATNVLQLIHTDVHGPITQTGYKGERYFVSFIDDYSKIAKVYCIKQKSEVYDRFVEYSNLMQNQTGKRIKEVRCDNGREYINKDFYALAKKEGFYLKPGPPYTHELNGVAERYNRTIMDRARCLLAEAKLDKKYWPECIYTAAFIGNRLPANT